MNSIYSGYAMSRFVAAFSGILVALLLFAGTTTSAYATSQNQAKGEPGPTVMLHTAQVCPAIFGKEAAKRDNQRLIQTKFASLLGEKGQYTVYYHTHKWKTPARVTLQGLTLVGTHDKDKDRYAVFYLDNELAGQTGCPDGFYKLRAGDNLFGKSYIVDIHDRLVLAETDKQLGFFQPQGYDDPFFRMIWRATWEIIWPVESSGSSTSSSSSKKKPSRGRSKKSRSSQRKSRSKRK